MLSCPDSSNQLSFHQLLQKLSGCHGLHARSPWLQHHWSHQCSGLGHLNQLWSEGQKPVAERPQSPFAFMMLGQLLFDTEEVIRSASTSHPYQETFWLHDKNNVDISNMLNKDMSMTVAASSPPPQHHSARTFCNSKPTDLHNLRCSKKPKLNIVET